jgi:hypothetical protein
MTEIMINNRRTGVRPCGFSSSTISEFVTPAKVA